MNESQLAYLIEQQFSLVVKLQGMLDQAVGQRNFNTELSKVLVDAIASLEGLKKLKDSVIPRIEAISSPIPEAIAFQLQDRENVRTDSL